MVGCDTFVVLPSLTSNGNLIFGKNSDRPRGEVQEVVYFPAKTNSPGEKLQCTYIEIDEVNETQAVLLSKPAWMWGAEMGANAAGVVIGNEAIYTKLPSSSEEKLIGMDLVRLGLERGKTASDALDVMTQLLEKHGQGGPCSDIMPEFTYYSSFLIADASGEAWVLETVGSHWAAQRVKDGFRNISNSLSITTDIDKMSANLKEYAIDNGFWDGQGEFDFSDVYMTGEKCDREDKGKALLEKYTGDANKFSVESMFKVLRDLDSNICRPISFDFPTTGSQVSSLSATGLSVHWVTATPDPSVSVFKPFIFTPGAVVSKHTISPTFDDDPAKVKPRFQREVDRRHTLYKLHAAAVVERPGVVEQLRTMEESCVQDVERFLSNGQPSPELDELLKDVVETEVKFYK